MINKYIVLYLITKGLFSIFFLSLSGFVFSGEEPNFAPGIIDRVPADQEKTPSNNVNTKAECIKKKGEWFENKEHNYKYCLIPYPDAGKLCKNSNDCEGHCIWPLDKKTLDDTPLPKDHGICQLNDDTDDCGRPHFSDGEIIYFKCD